MGKGETKVLYDRLAPAGGLGLGLGLGVSLGLAGGSARGSERLQVRSRGLPAISSRLARTRTNQT